MCVFHGQRIRKPIAVLLELCICSPQPEQAILWNVHVRRARVHERKSFILLYQFEAKLGLAENYGGAAPLRIISARPSLSLLLQPLRLLLVAVRAALPPGRAARSAQPQL